MAANKKKDNSTFVEKLNLRWAALRSIAHPVVMETHGGFGKLWQKVYADLPTGIVFEKDGKRAEVLAHQRPTWAVYEADCVAALAAGVGAHLPVNLLDVDPYGSPWDTIEAFLMSDRPKPKLLHIVINDGQRQNVQVTGGWSNSSLQSLIDRFGNGLYANYLDACQILMDEKATEAGYHLDRWHGYYCGKSKQMTHYWAVLERHSITTP